MPHFLCLTPSEKIWFGFLLHLISSLADFDLKTICNALVSVETKWFRIGIQLGIPRSKLEKFKKDEDDPLSAVVDYLLKGNVTESATAIPISWNSILTALKSDYVGEPGLAERISKNYCQQKDTKVAKGQTLGYT